MRYYPIFLDIKGRPCSVIGGGDVAERKVSSLLKAGAKITVVSPRLTEKIKKLALKGEIKHVKRSYRKGDLKGAFLVISASSVESVNRAVYEEAQRSGVLVNCVDDPERCNFIVPSVVDRGPLTIAIGTSGKSPLLAKTLRKDIGKAVGREYGTLTEILGAVRNKLLKNGVKNVKKERVINMLIKSPVRAWIKSGSWEEIDGFLMGLLGKGYSLTQLGIRLKRPGKAGLKLTPPDRGLND